MRPPVLWYLGAKKLADLIEAWLIQPFIACQTTSRCSFLLSHCCITINTNSTKQNDYDVRRRFLWRHKHKKMTLAFSFLTADFEQHRFLWICGLMREQQQSFTNCYRTTPGGAAWPPTSVKNLLWLLGNNLANFHCNRMNGSRAETWQRRTDVNILLLFFSSLIILIEIYMHLGVHHLQLSVKSQKKTPTTLRG